MSSLENKDRFLVVSVVLCVIYAVFAPRSTEFMCAAANGLIVVATLGVVVAGLRLRGVKVNSVGWGFFLLLSPLWLGFIVVPICKALM